MNPGPTLGAALHHVRFVIHPAEPTDHEVELICTRMNWESVDLLLGTVKLDATRDSEASPVLTLPQAAKRAGVSERTICRRIEEGRLEAMNLGNGRKAKWRIPADALARIAPPKAKSPPVAAVAPVPQAEPVIRKQRHRLQSAIDLSSVFGPAVRPASKPDTPPDEATPQRKRRHRRRLASLPDSMLPPA
jgi:excisionase family DNA binding protein